MSSLPSPFPTLSNLLKKYPRKFVQSSLHGYIKKVNEVSRLNQQLTEGGSGVAEHRYADSIQEIIVATQEYYGFMGTLPEDIRQFCLSVGAADNHETLDAAATLLGDQNLPLAPSPLLSAQAIRPRSYIMQIDAITNQLATLTDQTQLRVGKHGSQPVRTTVTLNMPDHMRIEGGGKLSTYDKSVINGVTSLIESGNTIFSIPMLYHAMTGKQNPTVDDSLYEELTSKLEQMRRMMLTIDLTEESDAQYITSENGETMELRDLQIEGYLLPLNKVSGILNGKRTELYQIIQHPPLYSYSKIRRQLASVEISLLNAPVNNNSTTIPLKTYLLQRIEMMKNPKNKICQSNILYDSIYQELGAVDANKTRKMRIRSYTTTILNYLVIKNYIEGYSEYKKGRSIAGLNIIL